MTRIRVLLAELPRLLHEIVESAVAAQSDMVLVGPRAAVESLAAAVARTEPEVLIIGLKDGASAQALAPLLYAHPRLRLLAVAGDGRRAVLYELRPHETPLGDVSPQGLLDAIRAAPVWMT